jgi:hypothetical protein
MDGKDFYVLLTALIGFACSAYVLLQYRSGKPTFTFYCRAGIVFSVLALILVFLFDSAVLLKGVAILAFALAVIATGLIWRRLKAQEDV